jgi:hypothetical protein
VSHIGYDASALRIGPEEDYWKGNSELVGTGEGGSSIYPSPCVAPTARPHSSHLGEMSAKRAMLYCSSFIIPVDRYRLLKFAVTSYRQANGHWIMTR